MVDDPSSHPERFPSEAEQTSERRRLFDILERLVVWKNSNDSDVLADARAEIVESCNGELPNVLDPFCGGGAIPLEARRLGLPAFGGDLNPIAVLISKGLVEIPPRFEGLASVNPHTSSTLDVGSWEGARGLADDIAFYGRWMQKRAFEQVGHLYPKVALPSDQGGGEANVIAWIWARTVRSPDPAWHGHVPLVRSWVLRKEKKNKPVVWVEPLLDRSTQRVRYRIRQGGRPEEGTIGRRGGTCIATGSPIGMDYIRKEGLDGLMGETPIAVVAQGISGRVYLSALDTAPAHCGEPIWQPGSFLPRNPRSFSPPLYGMMRWADLFTPRQLVALSTFSELLIEVRARVESDARGVDLVDDGIRLRDGGHGVTAYADAVLTYLGLAVSRCAAMWANLARWNSTAEKIQHMFGRQAVPMVWDYAEANPFSSSSGNWLGQVKPVHSALRAVPDGGCGEIIQRDVTARLKEVRMPVVCTDPPYYDNIPYADLSDFFYVWLRHNLSDIWPEETATMLTPKTEELIANPYRAGSKEAARVHFEEGMAQVLAVIAKRQHPEFPATVFYAFKQQETKKDGMASTGWETFLQGLVDAGLQVTATWPIRTETRSRMVAMGTAALASSVVIACRTRSVSASLATRREFLDVLYAELPKQMKVLKAQAIAPVDMAQSAIGPGMEVFSRYAKVIEADGSEMRVRTALALINEALEEVLSSEDTELDARTRWALTWYEQNGYDPGPFGDAETLSKAKNTSVASVERAEIAQSSAGKVRLLNRDELQPEWDPIQDPHRTDWKLTQYLIALLRESEKEAGDLLRTVGEGLGDRAQRLSYVLYQIANNKGWSADAVAYNSLIQSWHDIKRQAGTGPTLSDQSSLGI